MEAASLTSFDCTPVACSPFVSLASHTGTIVEYDFLGTPFVIITKDNIQIAISINVLKRVSYIRDGQMEWRENCATTDLRAIPNPLIISLLDDKREILETIRGWKMDEFMGALKLVGKSEDTLTGGVSPVVGDVRTPTQLHPYKITCPNPVPNVILTDPSSGCAEPSSNDALHIPTPPIPEAPRSRLLRYMSTFMKKN